MSRLSIFHLKSQPRNRRVLFWRSQNHGGSSCQPGCSYTYELQIRKDRDNTTTRKGDLLTPSLQPSSTIIGIAQQLLKGHGFQLQRSRPDQPLLLPEMGPRQRLVRQVPQALHEGRVAIIKS